MGDPIEDLEHPLCPDPAGRALAARFVLDEIDEEPREVDHAGILVRDDEAAGTDDRPEFGHRFIVDGHIEVLRRDTAARRAAELGRFELLVAFDAAADVEDKLAQGVPMGTSTRPVLLTAPARAKTFVPLLFSVPKLAYHSASLQDDGGNICVGFHVIEEGRGIEKTSDRRKRRPRPRLAPLSFDGEHEGRLLAADESACPDPYVEVEIEACLEDVLSEKLVLPAPGSMAQVSLSMASGYSALT